LLDLIARNTATDMDGNYVHFADKALRIALLLASLQGQEQIHLGQWWRAQRIAEDWRANLHALYDELQQFGAWSGWSQTASMEERILSVLQRYPASTAREVAQRIRGLTPAQARLILGELAEAGRVTILDGLGTIRYEEAEVTSGDKSGYPSSPWRPGTP
jgi:hypothetical protein